MDTKRLMEDNPIPYIQQILPGWIYTVIDTYSNDYAYLDQNWKRLCKDFKTTRKKIILVNDIPTGNDKKITIEDEHKIKVLDVLTRHGWVIRRTSEFVVCVVCKNKAIPSQQLWSILDSNPMFKGKIPKVWKNKCLNCMNLN